MLNLTRRGRLARPVLQCEQVEKNLANATNLGRGIKQRETTFLGLKNDNNIASYFNEAKHRKTKLCVQSNILIKRKAKYQRDEIANLAKRKSRENNYTGKLLLQIYVYEQSKREA